MKTAVDFTGSFLLTGMAMNKLTDFEIELEKIDKDISELKENAFSTPIDCERLTKFIYRLYQRAALTGNFAELEAAETAINAAIGHLKQTSDQYWLKANIDFKFHRLAEVKKDLELNPTLKASPQGRVLQADLYFQEGKYNEAKEAYENLIRDDNSWDNLARYAYFKFKMGDIDEANRLYSEAADELTAKQMRHFAWLELQRGLLDLAQGRLDEAEIHYRRADKAYSGYWIVEEHLAELLGAQGKFEEACALYQKIVAKVPRPELYQALGELYEFMGDEKQAQTWYEKAEISYLESVNRGGVHYYHHLVDFSADRGDTRQAVQWAREDLKLRNNFSTQSALAWALYRDKQVTEETLELINQSLSSGIKDAHLFSQAAQIFQAADQREKSDYYRQMAAAIKPHSHHFHVHR